MTVLSLRDTLIGAWKLEEYKTLPTPESSVQRPTHPMTKNVTGLILYTADGYMSAQMQMPGQKTFDGTIESHWTEACKRYFAYSGPFYITTEAAGPGSELKEILRHQFELCLLPDRVGELELRSHRFEEDGQVLVLGGVETVVIKGDRRIPVLRWRRAANNATNAPPAALPEIKID